MFFRATIRRAFTNWSYLSAVAGMFSTTASSSICVLLPDCLLLVESSPERYGLRGDSCIHLHFNGSMFGAWYWFHHNLVAAPGNSVGSKDDVRAVSSPPSTAVERAWKLGVDDGER